VLVHYAATKGGIAMLTKGMAVALAPHGIRVNIHGTVSTRPAERFVVTVGRA
jgi:NAD(P)-dependent dehydrogenase (short-subunit alcohol dehydrogenase family)